MNMFLKIFKNGLSVVIMIFVVLGCTSSKNIYKAEFQSTPVLIDGVLSEWEYPLIKPHAFTEMQFKASNDLENLYLCVRISDKEIQKRIMGLGLAVFIDSLGKRKEKIGLGFPLALDDQTYEMIAQKSVENNQLNFQKFNMEYAKACKEFELLGFVEENPKEKIRISNLASKDIKCIAGFDDFGALNCEYKIPLNLIFNSKLMDQRILGIGFKVNPPPQNADEDSGLFNDRYDPITSSAQMNNPMSNPMNNMLQQPTPNRRASRSVNQNIIGIWHKIELTIPSMKQ
jgi:hypothetical protein